ncbi:OLC1v1006479C1 [Oldenlandia corymbosa var. corymbosa]|uniref:OLC1v1006479C1 n=1 Tax=Oldenlandia corymbosa var. corymbosa TaxID=529605 RepID=A0AAV1DJD2_OLDCO|nr:OLC1v1006479C1 [Oldenlandia corymbosa var. corymbosa]
MAKEDISSTYEEARKQRLLENKKRFEDLGILSISKSLSDISNTEKKSQQRMKRPKPNGVYTLEPRRSSRARNPVATYRDDVNIDIGLSSTRKRSTRGWGSSWASYLARPVEEVRTASYEERTRALRSAEKVQRNLNSDNPSFVKSMLRSHVYSCFWLGLPSRFCEEHLPKSTTDMVLVNEEGAEYEAVYISHRVGLSGGWRAFALEHKLDDGDALVFELTEPTRFKVYIVRAFDCSTPEDSGACDDGEEAKKVKGQKTEDSKPKKKLRNSIGTTTDKENKSKKNLAASEKYEPSKPKKNSTPSKTDDPSVALGRRRSNRLK